jgi:hypothetical protein
LNGKSGKGHLHKRIYYNLKKEKQLDPTWIKWMNIVEPM